MIHYSLIIKRVLEDTTSAPIMAEAPPAKRLKVDEALHVPVATGAPQTEPQLPIHPIYKIELPPAPKFARLSSKNMNFHFSHLYRSPPDPNRDTQIYRLTQFIREAEMAYLNRLSTSQLFFVSFSTNFRSSSRPSTDLSRPTAPSSGKNISLFFLDLQRLKIVYFFDDFSDQIFVSCRFVSIEA
jgi:hypothetical protein